jgi:hypothetical protein
VSASSSKALLQRALEISRELAVAADKGDVEKTLSLDAERFRLLQGLAPTLDSDDMSVLREIGALNERSIGSFEHCRRIKARDLDLLVLGRRAVAAYGLNRPRF